MALLLLRAVLALTLLIQGAIYLRDPVSSAALLGIGLAAMAAGALLLAGFLTPLTGVLTAAGALAIWSASVLPGKPALLDSDATVVYAAVILVSVILLGPGAFSVDARMFGRREIIIPPAQVSSGR